MTQFLLKHFLLTLALVAYGSSVWGALCFFKVDNLGAHFGKRLLSVAGGVSIMVCICHLLQRQEFGIIGASVGCLLFLTSLVMFWWAWWTVRRYQFRFAFSSVVPAECVTVGPYRWIRHPFYSAYILSWLAPVAAAPEWSIALVCLVMTSLYVWAAMSEEAIITQSKHGYTYAEYRQRTGMFCPVPFLSWQTRPFDT